MSTESLRGTMQLHLNEHGAIVTARSHVVGNQYVKHVFLTQIASDRSLRVTDHTFIEDWDLVWDTYTGDRDSRDALLALCGDKLPPQLRLLDTYVQRLSAYVPTNGGASDGPFAVTADYRINARHNIEDVLNKLSKVELNKLLHSSFIRRV